MAKARGDSHLKVGVENLQDLFLNQRRLIGIIVCE